MSAIKSFNIVAVDEIEKMSKENHLQYVRSSMKDLNEHERERFIMYDDMSLGYQGCCYGNDLLEKSKMYKDLALNLYKIVDIIISLMEKDEYDDYSNDLKKHMLARANSGTICIPAWYAKDK